MLLKSPPHAARVAAVRILVVIGGVAAGWCAVALLGRWAGTSVTDARSGLVVAVCIVATAAVVVPAVLLVRSGRSPAAADLIVVATAVLASGAGTLGLQGTRWNFNAVLSDAGFRTQTVTRYADSPQLQDYGYSGLPAYYPPGFGWVQGRIASLLDVPAWLVMKPATLVLAALIPLLAYVFWRRILPDVKAALVVLGTTIAAADLTKPDEWLVLAVGLPWWLDMVREARRPGRRPWPVLGHGAVLGALLLIHTYYWLPLAIAAVLGVLLDLVLRRRVRPAPLRAVGVAIVGLTISAVYWLPPMLLRLSGAPSDNLQLRYLPRDFIPSPVPWPPGLEVILLAVAAAVWLVLRVRRNAVAEGLALALAGSYLFVLVGVLLQSLGVGLLVHKTDELVLAVFAAAGVLGVVEVISGFGRRLSTVQRGTRVGALVTVVVASTLAAPAVVHFVDIWARGANATAAHNVRYPDGSRPQGYDPRGPHVQRDVFLHQPEDPAPNDVVEAWRELSGRQPSEDTETVLVTTRVGMAATTAVHTFNSWKSIYSHPNGEYAARLDFLARVAACDSPRCAAEMLRTNRFDGVDGLVLERDGDDLVMPFGQDDFPVSWDLEAIRFPVRLFSEPQFARTEVDGVVVVFIR